MEDLLLCTGLTRIRLWSFLSWVERMRVALRIRLVKDGSAGNHQGNRERNDQACKSSCRGSHQAVEGARRSVARRRGNAPDEPCDGESANEDAHVSVFVVHADARDLGPIET